MIVRKYIFVTAAVSSPAVADVEVPPSALFHIIGKGQSTYSCQVYILIWDEDGKQLRSLSEDHDVDIAFEREGGRLGLSLRGTEPNIMRVKEEINKIQQVRNALPLFAVLNSSLIYITQNVVAHNFSMPSGRSPSMDLVRKISLKTDAYVENLEADGEVGETHILHWLRVDTAADIDFRCRRSKFAACVPNSRKADCRRMFSSICLVGALVTLTTVHADAPVRASAQGKLDARPSYCCEAEVRYVPVPVSCATLASPG
jgi:hypothetical protein